MRNLKILSSTQQKNMKTIDIKGKVRTETGKKASNALRNSSNVPCVLYGEEKNIHFYGFETDFRHLVYTPHVFIVNIDIDGKVYKAIMQDIQFHPVTDRILHIDFLKVSDDKPTKIEIPVVTVGTSPGVTSGGILHIIKRKLKVQGLIANLPDALEVNIENLTIGKSVKISEISFENLVILEPAASIVCSVKTTRVAKSIEDEGEGEGEEGDAEKTEDK